MSGVLLVLPTRLHVAMHHASLAEADPTRTCVGIHAISFEELETSIIESALSGQRVAPSTLSDLALRRACDLAAPADDSLVRAFERPDFAKHVGASLRALWRAGVRPEQEATAVSLLAGRRRARLEGLFGVARAYESDLRRAGCFDRDLGRLRASSALGPTHAGARKAPLHDAPLHDAPLHDVPLPNTPLPNTPLRNVPLPEALMGYSRLVISGVHTLGPARLGLLGALASRLAPDCELVVSVPHMQSGSRYFRTTERLLGRLERLGDRPGASCTVIPFEPGAAGHSTAHDSTRASSGLTLGGSVLRELVSHRAGLGDVERSAPPATPASSQSIVVLEAPDRGTEQVAVARLVREWLQAGVAPEQIAIVPRQVDASVRGLERALDKRGVAVHAAHGSVLAHVPIIRVLVDLIDAASRGWPRDDARRLLGSTYLDPWRRKEKLSSGAALARTLAQVAVRPSPEDDGRTLVEALTRFERGTQSARSARRAIERLHALTAPVREPANLVTFLERVRVLVGELELEASAHRCPGGRDQLRAWLLASDDPPAARGMARDIDALDRLNVLLEQLAQAADSLGWRGELALPQLHSILHQALAGATVPAIGLRGGAVRIVGVHDVVGLEFEAVVMMGLSDGSFPSSPSTDALLGVDERIAIDRGLREVRATPDDSPLQDDPAALFEEAAMPLAPHAAHHQTEALLFALALCSARERLALACATADDGGRPLNRSTFLEDVLSALSPEVVEQRGWVVERRSVPRAKAPPLARAFGVDDASLAAMTGLAALPSSMSLAEAAREDLAASLPDTSDALNLRPALAAAATERRRMAARRGVRLPSEQSERFLASLGPLNAQSTSRGLQRLARFGSREQPLSPTAIEAMARCPFQYLASRVLSLPSEREAGDDLDPRRQGELAHACFEAAVNALRARGLTPMRARLSKQASELAISVARELVEQRLAAHPIEAAMRGYLCQALPERVGGLVRWLYEQDDGYEPLAVERAFGTQKGWPALELPHETEPSVFVRGRIDLLERANNAYRVSDLKLGALSGIERRLAPDHLGVDSLQLLLYAAACSQAFSAPDTEAPSAQLALSFSAPTADVQQDETSADDTPQVDARYLSFQQQRGSRTVRSVLARRSALSQRSGANVVDPDSLMTARGDSGQPSALAERVHALVQQVRAADFCPAPYREACTHCDYSAVCRSSEEHTA